MIESSSTKRISFLNIPVDSLTMAETIEKIDDAIICKQQINHVVINAGKVVSMLNNKELFDSVVNCNLINADGQSIVWASRFLGNQLPERVAGADLMQNLIKLAYQKGYKCFFFGATEDVVKKVVEVYAKTYDPSVIAGYRNGYYNKEEEASIAHQIANSGAHLLFVAMTSPKKEIFLDKYKETLKEVSFTMGVGGTFDVIAGYTKRAPIWMQNAGMEWFFRLIQEPRRMWRRYLIGNSKFIYYVLREKYKIRK